MIEILHPHRRNRLYRNGQKLYKLIKAKPLSMLLKAGPIETKSVAPPDSPPATISLKLQKL